MKLFRRALATGLVVGLTGLVTPVVGASAEVAATPAVTSPSFDGKVRTFARSGSIVYVGGDFDQVTATNGTFARAGAAAFNMDTGRVLAWDPQPNGNVTDLAVGVEGVYLTGEFTALRGTPRKSVALVRKDRAGGLLPRFRHNFDDAANTVVLAKGRVYIGGRFEKVDGKSRPRLAAFKRAPRSPMLAWAPRAAGGQVRDLVLTKQGLYVAGGFIALNQRPAYANLGLVRTTNGSLVRSFRPGIKTLVIDIHVVRGRIYAGVGGDGGGSLVAANRTTGARAWDVQLNGDVQALSVMNGRVYAGGHFSQVCTDGQNDPITGDCQGATAARSKAAAFSPAGVLSSWAPQFNSFDGISAMATVPKREWLMVGGDFTTVNGDPAVRFARFAPAP